jgi:3alpha(or 20beta)-hydroxysteroid dehydrogenase
MGAEHARVLIAQGAQVTITDVLEVEGEALAAELGASAQFIQHDVADDEGWRRVMSSIAASRGGLDFLVNNAGIARFESLPETTVESFSRHQRINEMAVFLGMKHAVAPMTARGGGSIVNVSSLGGMRVGGNDIAYVSSKWAVRGMTKSAAKELGPLGIRVNSIHPGLVQTPMLAEVSDAVIRQRTNAVPLRRAGTPRDIANVVAFLLSDDASYVTGAEIVIDGGLGL